MMKQRVYSGSALLLVTFILSACAKSTEPPIPFQGPLNPGFETTGSWVLSSSTDLCNNALGAQRASIVSGTGFLPSAGAFYASIAACSWLTSGRTASAYQDAVDLTHSTTLTFDYTLTGVIGAGGGTATAQLLFTSTGTAVLWTKAITVTTVLPIQTLTETVTLPATTVPGRFTISLNVAGGGNPNATKSDMIFGVDHFVVK